MNTKKLIARTVIIFTALTIAGMIVIISAQSVSNAFEQTIMVATGSAIFGAGLTFFLMRITNPYEK